MAIDRERWEREAADDGPDLRWGRHELERGRRQIEALLSLRIADAMGGTPDEIVERIMEDFDADRR